MASDAEKSNTVRAFADHARAAVARGGWPSIGAIAVTAP
jgi:hypothetical protein